MKASEWEGKRVMTLREITNGWVTLPAGTLATVVRKFGGLWLEHTCNCGIKVKLSRVSVESVEVIQ